jgi:hypothetical protein
MHSETSGTDSAALRGPGRPYMAIAARMLAAIHAQPGGPFVRRPPAGTARGIDFYRASRLVPVLAEAVARYELAHGRLPNLAHPSSMMEKLLWAKFFAPVPMPSPADKLGLARYIPPSHRAGVELAERVWVGDRPELPGDGEVPPGDYFLKASHVSGFQCAVRYPLSEAQRRAAQSQAAGWLAAGYGAGWGEWWYAPVERRIFLERHLGHPGADLPDWKFWVIGGRVRALHVVRQRSLEPSMVHYTRDFRHLPVSRADYPAGEPLERPAQFDAAVDAAEAIGRAFCFARVDFYLPDERRIVLGEITLCPDNARIVYRPLDFDFWLGAPWDVDAPAPAATG